MEPCVAMAGPLSICVDAMSWQTYRHGVMKACGTHLDHCVQAVGIDTDKGYWKVRNSWNTDWGEDGFIRLAFGRNTCGLTHDATWASVKSAIVPSPPAEVDEDGSSLIKGLVVEEDY